MIDYVESEYSIRETEMMICMKEQDYYLTLDWRIHFSLDNWIIVNKILKAEDNCDALCVAGDGGKDGS